MNGSTLAWSFLQWFSKVLTTWKRLHEGTLQWAVVHYISQSKATAYNYYLFQQYGHGSHTSRVAAIWGQLLVGMLTNSISLSSSGLSSRWLVTLKMAGRALDTIHILQPWISEPLMFTEMLQVFVILQAYLWAVLRCQGQWWQVHEGNVWTMNTARGERSELVEGEMRVPLRFFKHRKYMKTVAAY